jgi:hypothetical protein
MAMRRKRLVTVSVTRNGESLKGHACIVHEGVTQPEMVRAARIVCDGLLATCDSYGLRFADLLTPEERATWVARLTVELPAPSKPKGGARVGKA